MTVPQDHLQEEPAERNDDEGKPKFGRLLLVLASAVLLIILLTFISDAYYSS